MEKVKDVTNMFYIIVVMVPLIIVTFILLAVLLAPAYLATLIGGFIFGDSFHSKLSRVLRPLGIKAGTK